MSKSSLHKRYKVPKIKKNSYLDTKLEARLKPKVTGLIDMQYPSKRQVANYWIIYVLKLENRCWYVGKTTRDKFSKNIRNHFNGVYSWFTAENKPQIIHDIEIYPHEIGMSMAGHIQDEWVLSMAEELGRDFVRGGGYNQREPNWSGYKKEELPFLNREF